MNNRTDEKDALKLIPCCKKGLGFCGWLGQGRLVKQKKKAILLYKFSMVRDTNHLKRISNIIWQHGWWVHHRLKEDTICELLVLSFFNKRVYSCVRRFILKECSASLTDKHCIAIASLGGDRRRVPSINDIRKIFVFLDPLLSAFGTDLQCRN